MLAPIADQLSRSVIAVDYDGTLAPIVDDPADAVADRSARDALGALVGRAALVAVVSGRPIEFLREQLRLDGVTLIGQYGLERVVDGDVVVDERATPYLDAVEAAAEEAERAWPALLVERKGRLAVTIHWRTGDAPRSEKLHELAARHKLAYLDTRMACELRPPVPVDKGSALADLLQASDVDMAAFAGDDRGDLAVFDALDRLEADGRLTHTARIAVHSPEAPAELLERADLIVDGPAGVAELLSSLLVRP